MIRNFNKLYILPSLTILKAGWK